jgi:hypothetical protein
MVSFQGKDFSLLLEKKGPELNNERLGHSCGRIRRDKEGQGIIVAGSNNGSSYMSSVEILHVGSKEWQTGPELPFHIGYSQMVEDPNGGVVLIGGTTYSLDNLDTLYKLIHAGQDGVWTKMKQKLMSVAYSFFDS